MIIKLRCNFTLKKIYLIFSHCHIYGIGEWLTKSYKPLIETALKFVEVNIQGNP